MVRYEVWYKKIGFRKERDFVYVKSLDPLEVIFPIKSVFHYYSEDITKYPTRNIPLFRNIKDGYVVNKLEFIKPKYEFRKLRLKENILYSKVKSMYGDFKTEKEKKILSKIKSSSTFLKDDALIYNYSYIADNYKKYERASTNYEFNYNVLSTIINNIAEFNEYYVNNAKAYKGEFDINHFVKVDIPTMLIKLSIIRELLDKLPRENKELWETIYSPERMWIFQIYMSLRKDLYKLSIFNNVKLVRDMKSINFVFSLPGKIMIVNMARLLSFDKEFQELKFSESSLRMDPRKLMKLINLMYQMFILAPSFKEEEIESGANADVIVEKLKTLAGSGNSKLLKAITSSKKDKNKEGLSISEDDIEKAIEEEPEESDIDTVLESIVEDVVEKDEDVEVINTFVENENATKTVFNDKKKILKQYEPDEEIELILEDMKLNGQIDDKKYKKIKEELNKILNEESPYRDGKKIKDMIRINPEEIKIAKDEKKIRTNLVTVPNEDMLENTVGVYDKKYIENVLKKDIISTVFSVQKAGMVIKNYEIKEHDDILGGYEEHTITFQDVKGRSTPTIKFKIPKIQPNGQFKMSGNTYVLRKQRVDLPIKKINPKRVALSSAYGKIFIDKAPYKKLDQGFAIKKELLKLAEAKKVKNIVTGESVVSDVELPLYYSMMARYVRSFKMGNYTFFFDYETRYDIVDSKKYDVDKIEEKGKYVVCGVDNKGNPLLMDKDNNVYLYDGKKMKLLGFIFDVIGIQLDHNKDEYAMVKIYKNYVPVVYLLWYYLGFENTFKILDTKYYISEKRKQVDPETEMIVKFADGYLIIKVDTPLKKMVFKGLNYFDKQNKQFPITVFKNREEMLNFFNEIGLSLAHITEIKLLDKLYVDPVTANILKEMGEPTTFTGLLIKASEMLTTDYYINQQSMKGYAIRGYDRVPQFIYSKMVDAIREKENASYFGSNRLTFDPYSIWRIMNEDSTSILVDDINPIAYLKQKHDTTYTGMFGRSKESMSKSTRELHPDDIGIISEATKDSGDVGITAYMSANPVLGSVRGLKEDIKKLNIDNIISDSGLLAQFSITDDPKRLNFIQIQNNHIIPIKGAKVYPIRTGYESVLPYKLDRKFIGFAEEDGVVEKVMKNKIIVKYKSGKQDTFLYKNWVSKEESHTAWLHELVPNVKEGQKVKQGDVIYYDKSFFEPDIFDPTKVVYRAYLVARLAMIENNETYEDSVVYTSKFVKDGAIEYIKTRSIIVNKDDEIGHYKKPGEKVHPTDALLTISTGIVDTDSNFDEKSLDILEGFVKTTPKAKVEGTIYEIKVLYNCDKDELSPSLKKLVEETEKYLIDPQTGKRYEGRVDSSYSINGKPLDESSVEIKYYIKVVSGFGYGDKSIVGNQLKNTVGLIVDYPIKTEDGRDVDGMFSNRALMARIVNSPYLMGTTCALLRIVTENVLKMYYGDVTVGNENNEFNDHGNDNDTGYESLFPDKHKAVKAINSILKSNDTLCKNKGEDGHFYLYHYGKPGYDSIRSLAFINDEDAKRRAIELMGEAKYESYQYEVSSFLEPLNKHNIEKLIKNGFKAYSRVDTMVEYAIDLLDKYNRESIKYAIITSIPEQQLWMDEHWEEWYKQHENDDEYDFIKAKEKLLEQMYKEIGVPYKMSVDELIYVVRTHHWCNMDKYVDLNIVCGSKQQYATCIPHVILGIKRPLKFTESRIVYGG
jgi:hypothetical protein